MALIDLVVEPGDTAVLTRRVSVCVTVTVTPGSTAPVPSVTRPLIWPLDTCAAAGAARTKAIAATRIPIMRFIDPSSGCCRAANEDAAADEISWKACDVNGRTP
jgi:hypothetical protein